jgi:hypothetical protein
LFFQKLPLLVSIYEASLIILANFELDVHIVIVITLGMIVDDLLLHAVVMLLSKGSHIYSLNYRFL